MFLSCFSISCFNNVLLPTCLAPVIRIALPLNILASIDACIVLSIFIISKNQNCKISKFWNRPNPQNDLGILGAGLKGALGGAVKLFGLSGRQKATYDVSLSTQYFYNQNKPEFGSIRKKKAEQTVIDRRKKVSNGFINTIKKSFENIQNYKSKLPEKEHINMKIENSQSNQNEILLYLNYGEKKLGAYKITVIRYR